MLNLVKLYFGVFNAMASQYIQYAILFLLGIILVAALGVPFSNMTGSMSHEAASSRLEAITITTADYIEHLNERVLYNQISEASFSLPLPRYISNQLFILTIQESAGKYYLHGELQNDNSLSFVVQVKLYSDYSISGTLNSEMNSHKIDFYFSAIQIFSKYA
jgi:hypothetical protein